MLCKCGCGQATRPAPQTHKAKGWVRGQPMRFIHGHHLRLREQPRGEESPRWLGDSVVYESAHTRIRRTHGPAAVHSCVDCGEQAQEWSYKDRQGYSTDFSDYAPRCRPCHRRYDSTLKD